MLELLTGLGLATSAGLNAWIPLLVVGLLSRYTGLLTLPEAWQWLDNGWLLSVLAGLFVIELVADKIPIVDSVNDVVQTVIRPGSGGVVFGAGSSAETAAVTDPAQLFSGGDWQPIAVGVAIALAVHVAKALLRAILNTATAGLAAPVLSTVEDAGSVSLAVAAILVPVLVIGLLLGLPLLTWWLVRRVRRRRRAANATGTDHRIR
ncbi:DUF4126 domain-containing protein [Natronosporangium hydrolyticum]|uniref:DUF4126 domain-containing protein n=1 Tax=Natronosporangium hydrolyticum TaxID=2811111 RepID=A0A895YP31_9ACTN|nr:DUF4126 domain-containing protein [Natronosporangium hydrolyticum]QSB15870.1 DUF4126 domain-containing protein [Natronosporangium hydrolyticum]